MKTSYLVVGSLFTFAVGIAATLGIHAALSNLSRPVSAQQPTLAHLPQPAQPQSARSFESLSLCEQLDAIAKSGKSVAQFIANSGRYSQFEANVRTYCTWHTGQLNQAYAVLNPPVVTIRPKIVQTPVVINSPILQPTPLVTYPGSHTIVINNPGNPVKDPSNSGPGGPVGGDPGDSNGSSNSGPGRPVGGDPGDSNGSSNSGPGGPVGGDPQ